MTSSEREALIRETIATSLAKAQSWEYKNLPRWKNYKTGVPGKNDYLEAADAVLEAIGSIGGSVSVYDQAIPQMHE